MSQARPVPLPTRYPLYLALSKRDGAPIALVEAKNREQAAARVAYVVGQLGLSDWHEVDIRPAEGYLSRVPTFLDGFFHARKVQATTH